LHDDPQGNIVRVGAFDIFEPEPQLQSPRLVLTLRPWIDVGQAGTNAANYLEAHWNAVPLAELVRPGEFYDFTRYRPTIAWFEGKRTVTIPNTAVRWARHNGQDWVFVHALEPHMRGEDYRDSLISLVEFLGVTEYIQIGSMYAPVPHTRPPVLSGSSTRDDLKGVLREMGIRTSTYEGPTSILATVSDRLATRGIAYTSFLVQLPAYAQLDTDYRGRYAILRTLDTLYHLGTDLRGLRQEGDAQYLAIDTALQQNPGVANWVRELEGSHDQESTGNTGETPAVTLSPELERFLNEVQSSLDSPD
jgi:hypothetical protein